ncbi:FtsW/RodA/SpoVE family cell cycle protein [bacterium]|nr:FtsW/RodA/SpoVE family cell cycle protein [bacterium]
MAAGVGPYLSNLGPGQINRFFVFLKATGLVFIPMVLTLRQPDLGTALTIGLLFLPMLYWAGLSFFRILMLLAPLVSLIAASHLIALSSVMLIVNLYYRKGTRVLLGAGFLQGTQTNLNFLPAPHAYFIFAVFGEEFGLLGVLIVCLLYLFLLLSFIKLAERADKQFYCLTLIGITSLLAAIFL